MPLRATCCRVRPRPRLRSFVLCLCFALSLCDLECAHIHSFLLELYEPAKPAELHVYTRGLLRGRIRTGAHNLNTSSDLQKALELLSLELGTAEGLLSFERLPNQRQKISRQQGESRCGAAAAAVHLELLFGSTQGGLKVQYKVHCKAILNQFLATLPRHESAAVGRLSLIHI